MGPKTFSIVSSVSMGLTITAAALSIIGTIITGFYPGVIVLSLLPLAPAGTRFYVKKITGRPDNAKDNSYTALILINVLCILVVLWMAFVIVHDRVLNDCC